MHAKAMIHKNRLKSIYATPPLPQWDGSPLQGYPQHQICWYPVVQLGEMRHCESKVCAYVVFLS